MNKELKTLLIVGGVTIAVIGLLVGLSKYKASTKPVASEAVVRADSHATGPKDAKVTLVEFGDFQCPACAQSEPMVKQLIADYPNDLRFSFRNFPLVSIHKNATSSAEAAEAAAKQGKYWEMHDRLYERQNEWANVGNPREIYKGYAKDLGLDVAKFEQDMQSSEVSNIIKRDVNDAGVLGVNATPTFYLNGKKVEGATYEGLKKQIDEAIGANKESGNPEASVGAEPAAE